METEIASAGLHENIIPSLLLSGVDDGVILIYPFVPSRSAAPQALKNPDATTLSPRLSPLWGNHPRV